MKTYPVEEWERIEKVIRSCTLCYVGMADGEGNPYVLPMNFGYEEGVIWLHSAQEGHSITILEQHPKVCITFCTDPKLVWQHEKVACSYRMQATSVICRGRVIFVEEEEVKEMALHSIMRQYSGRTFSYSAPSVRNVKIWKVEVDDLSAREFGVPNRNSLKYKDRQQF
ncbi:MAG: pyridoxamine 5'-phosphate oxidase family protein [Proteiniphilum sp.]|nr:pyridoxamine 5'-phosphate oxidase family protein [Proteiniphilum sp.]MDD4801070.1 pyridoxamine 5'-phosphate oxidase family protein [Proteiniphilum sp.]